MIIHASSKEAVTVTKHSKTSTYVDGHCQRAFSYFPKEVPLIRTAQADQQCFLIHFKDGSSLPVMEDDLVKLKSGECSVLDLTKKYETKLLS